MSIKSAAVIKCFTVICLTGGATETVELGYCRANTAQPNNHSCSVRGCFLCIWQIIEEQVICHFNICCYGQEANICYYSSVTSQESVAWILWQCSSWTCTIMSFPYKSSPSNRIDSPFSSLFWQTHCRGPNASCPHCNSEAIYQIWVLTC